MKKFDNGQRFIIIYLVIYLVFSFVVGLSAFEYLGIKFIKINYLLGIYVAISICAAIYIYFYTVKMFRHGDELEDNINPETGEDESKKRERERQQKLEDATQRRKKALEEKKRLESIVSEISNGLSKSADINEYFDKLLINISQPFKTVQGIAYALNSKTNKFETKSTYAYYTTESFKEFELGEGIPGQVAKDKKILLMENIPEDYIRIVSGLGTGTPKYLLVVPIISQNETIAILELASFEKTDINFDNFLNMLNNAISGGVVNKLRGIGSSIHDEQKSSQQSEKNDK